jgi:hypothetical protein
VLNGGPVNTITVIGALAGLPLAGAALLALSSTNFLDRFLSRFADDTGSAQTRWDMFEVFARIPFADLITGPDPREVMTWQTLFGLERGIESFWLSMMLSYGLLVSCVIFAALLMLCGVIVRRCKPGAALVLLYFIAVASVSLSLAGKSSVLTIVTLMLLVLMRPLPIAWPIAWPGSRHAQTASPRCRAI